ncbi:MAG: rod shape-determining protein MreC [Ferruginibacter sp.]|nr:rod shape-determining protein MreC [Ferruginibacter sp.]
MRNIFLFVRRYFNLLFFLLLQVVSVYFIIHYSKYHQAAFGNTANQVTGKVNTQYSNIERYFHLKKTNDSLIKANEGLYNKLKVDFELPDTSTKAVIDSIMIDSIMQFKKYTYLAARVVSNSVSAQNNYIVLSRGRLRNLRPGMGIVDLNNAVIGITTDVSDDFAVVMSLLHKDSHISGKLLKGGETGTLSWDGKEPNMITLTNIPKSAKIAKGDSVISSGFSTSFPKGIMIGTVEAVYKEVSTSNFKIKLRTAANFYNLEYAYAIDNSQQNAINNILDKIKDKH